MSNDGVDSGLWNEDDEFDCLPSSAQGSPPPGWVRPIPSLVNELNVFEAANERESQDTSWLDDLPSTSMGKFLLNL